MIESSETLIKLGVNHGFASKNEQISAVSLVKQVHSAAILSLDCLLEVSEADGIYSDRKHSRLGIVTADCLPILIAANDRSLVACIHAGWRGFFSGIVSKSFIALIRERDLRPSDFIFAIGPSVSAKNYEVGADLLAQLSKAKLSLTASERELAVSRFEQKYFFDLKYLAYLELKCLGVPSSSIDLSPTCTFSQLEWASYRRDGKNCGRNLSFIEL